MNKHAHICTNIHTSLQKISIQWGFQVHKKQDGDTLVETVSQLNDFTQIPWEILR